MATKSQAPYENNPFMLGIEGLKLIFDRAKGIGIYSIVLTGTTFLLAIVFYVANLIAQAMTSSEESSYEAQAFAPQPAEIAGIVGLVVLGTLVYMAISLLLFGVLEYGAAMAAKGKRAGLKEGFLVVLRQFPAYFWMYLLFTIKVLLWSLLLIVPGIIMFNRYILAGTVFFAEGKRGNAALKRSAELTKGAWLTTYGGAWIWSIISQGIATLVFWPGCMAVLYRQLADVTDRGEPKSPAHILSWLTLLVPFALAALYIVFIIMLFVLLAATGTAAP
ncbi:MAG: hypothetical protein V4678_03255 [Patescibacteria group bacterium]